MANTISSSSSTTVEIEEGNAHKNIKEKKFTSIVYKGAGVKGFAYIGALRALEKENVTSAIKRVGGASAGAVMALLTGIGMTSKEIEDAFVNNFRENFIPKAVADSIHIFKKLASKQFGLYEGKYLKKAFLKIVKDHLCKADANDSPQLKQFKEEIKAKDTITFADITQWQSLKKFKRDIFIVVTNLSTGLPEVFSSVATPNMDVILAVRASIAIPLLFKPIKIIKKDDNSSKMQNQKKISYEEVIEKKGLDWVRDLIQKKNSKYELYADGGLVDNYPTDLFDYNQYLEKPDKTEDPDNYSHNEDILGLFIDNTNAVKKMQGKPIVAIELKNNAQFVKHLMSTILDNSLVNTTRLMRQEKDRTIFIDPGEIGTVEVSINKRKREMLIEAGNKAVTEFFKAYKDSSINERQMKKYAEVTKNEIKELPSVHESSDEEGKIYCNIM